MPEHDAPYKTVGGGKLRTVLTTAQPDDPHFSGGGLRLVLVVLLDLVPVLPLDDVLVLPLDVVPSLAVVSVLGLVPLFAPPPHAATRSPTATIAGSAPRRREVEDIRKGPLPISESVAGYNK